MIYPLIIVGAGASGLAAAVTAGRAGAEALVLEKKEQPLKKLLLTGNGRCNFTNLNISADAYFSHDTGFPERFLRNFRTEDALSFFRELGLYPSYRGDYVYPMSMQAQSVREALLQGIQGLPVSIRCGIAVRNISCDIKKRLFSLQYEGGDFQCRKLIIAGGTPAGVRDKEAFSADRILRSFGHHVYPLKPALVKLLGKNGFESYWDGVRHHCIVKLQRKSDGKVFSEEGEVQFARDGISGIPVFQLSHPAGEELELEGQAAVIFDLIPDLSEDALFNALNQLKNSPYHAGRELRDILTGFLPKKLIKAVFSQNEEAGRKTACSLSEGELRTVSGLLKAFPYRVSGCGDALLSQVMRGGADLREFTDQLESRIIPGLYAAGEILDIDGKCGGYNLHFAWGSGILAGRSAAESLLGKAL